MVFKEPEFVYTNDIEEIAPLTLNLTLSKKDSNNIEIELRKKVRINLTENSSKEFWKKFFSRSLEGKAVRANILLVFRDKFGAACKIKELDLLEKGTKIKTD